MGILPKMLSGTRTEGIERERELLGEKKEKREFLSEMSQSSNAQASENVSPPKMLVKLKNPLKQGWM